MLQKISSNYCSMFLFIAVLIIAGCATTRSPLVNAARTGDVNSIKSLCHIGCNINELDKRGQTPLIHAIIEKKVDAAKVLIESGADVTIKDMQGYDALQWAVYYDNPEIISLLLDKGADIESKVGQGWTPLTYAVSYGYLKVINLLLDRGANIEARDSLGWTPLMQTVYSSNSVETARLLIQRGADVNAKDKESKTLPILARQNGNDKLANDLIRESYLKAGESKIAKIFFIRGDNLYYRFTAPISIDDYVVNLQRNSIDYVYVKPGKCLMTIKGGRAQIIRGGFGDHITTFDAQAGKTYYFEVSVRTGSVLSQLGGGMVGVIIESAIAGDKAGPFEIIPLEESVAKEMIKELQQEVNK